MDPEFAPGSAHVAHAPVSNPTSEAWTYEAELYLVKNSTKYSSSGMISFTLAAGASDVIDFPITMPTEPGTYEVYLDVFVAGDLIAAYQSPDDVTSDHTASPSATAESSSASGASHPGKDRETSTGVRDTPCVVVTAVLVSRGSWESAWMSSVCSGMPSL